MDPGPLRGQLGTGILHHVEVVSVLSAPASSATSTATPSSLARNILATVQPLELEANLPASG